MITQLIILSLIISVVAFSSCHLNGNINKEVEYIRIIYYPNPQLRDSPLEIVVDHDYQKKYLVNIINEADRTKWDAPDRVLTEGRYKVEFVYRDKSVHVFDVSGYRYFYWENRDTDLDNPKLLFAIREYIFDEFIKGGIRFEPC